jgi:hypothetical protein
LTMSHNLPAAYTTWLSTRPQCVQDLAKEFPWLSQVSVNGKTYFVIGYTEEDMIIVSQTYPVHFQLAMETKEYVCAKSLRTELN